MDARSIGGKKIMVVDGKDGNKFVSYEILTDSARLLEMRGKWTAPRLRMAWNIAIQKHFKVAHPAKAELLERVNEERNKHLV